jgi:hypothetical protein
MPGRRETEARARKIRRRRWRVEKLREFVRARGGPKGSVRQERIMASEGR